jgi:hypothetical protein
MLLSLQRRKGARLLLPGALYHPSRQRKPVDRSSESSDVLLPSDNAVRSSPSSEGGKVVLGEGLIRERGGSETVESSDGGLTCLRGVGGEEVGGGGGRGGESLRTPSESGEIVQVGGSARESSSYCFCECSESV